MGSLQDGVLLGAALLTAIGIALPASAGPPFRTDDPIPVEPGHWEVFNFSSATHAAGDTSGTLWGTDANYGAAPNLQLHATLPIALDAPVGNGMRAGLGDAELGAKYRFVTGDPNGWRPDAAIYPAVDFPTGNAARGLGRGHTRLFLPLWLQKSVGDWSTFGGLGYWINPGAGNRNFWYFGWAVERPLTDKLSIGAELFYQTADTDQGKDQSGFSIGATYDLSENWHLMVAAGRGLQNAGATNEFSYYAALQWTY
ncbi:MAG: hypothetical protein JO008_07315 [Alphaproteobacteria bacterium]|nr:hypothetical protein [Alphaproteobacteria bacterium]